MNKGMSLYLTEGIFLVDLIRFENFVCVFCVYEWSAENKGFVWVFSS